ncbi:MAG: hypothetical protein MJZ29_10650 [Bacteroidaceae bacterium]|nr:hypothetical protein [Bacteroidaceae bacterium]
MKKKILKVLLLAFLGITFVYSFFDSMRSFGSDVAENGRIIYYDMPFCRVPTSSAFGGRLVSSLFKKDGVNDGKAPFGHAGIIVEDSKGRLTLYQYGRFSRGIGKVLPSGKGNWQRMAIGNRNGKSDQELLNALGPRILAGMGGHKKAGNRVDAYIMDVDDITPVVNYIERDAANPDRYRYFLFTDNTCGGTARDAFDRGRGFIGRVISKWADNVGNLIPLPSHIWSAMTHSGNLFGLTGFSPEGNAPCLGTTKVVYKE